MSLLTDTDLTQMICNNRLWTDKDKTVHIYPFSEDYLTPVGYDLRVGSLYLSHSDPEGVPRELKVDEEILIKPGDLVMIQTLEKVGMPQNRNLSAMLLSKVSKVTKGLSPIASTIDADWDGQLLIPLCNHSKYNVTLKYGEPFLTIIFLENKSPSTTSSGHRPGRWDQFIREWSARGREVAEKARKKRRREKSIIIGFIGLALLFPVLFGVFGFFKFENQTLFIAIISLGAALGAVIVELLQVISKFKE